MRLAYILIVLILASGGILGCSRTEMPKAILKQTLDGNPRDFSNRFDLLATEAAINSFRTREMVVVRLNLVEYWKIDHNQCIERLDRFANLERGVDVGEFVVTISNVDETINFKILEALCDILSEEVGTMSINEGPHQESRYSLIRLVE